MARSVALAPNGDVEHLHRRGELLTDLPHKMDGVAAPEPHECLGHGLDGGLPGPPVIGVVAVHRVDVPVPARTVKFQELTVQRKRVRLQLTNETAPANIEPSTRC